MTTPNDRSNNFPTHHTIPNTEAVSSDSHKTLLPYIFRALAAHVPANCSILDVGCGSGELSAAIHMEGYTITGIDPEEKKISAAKKQFPDIDFRIGSGYDDLPVTVGKFKAIISIEVIEHIYDPRKFTRSIFSSLENGGTAIFSTPYHGYLKNLAISLSGGWDRHFTALWDNGHIKFWSQDTLGILLKEAGFTNIEFHRAGRIPPLAKSLIAVATK